MKKNIHPKYERSIVRCVNCSNEFETGSISTDIKVDTCAKCHPFYTGTQVGAKVAGRIEKFNAKLTKANKTDKKNK